MSKKTLDVNFEIADKIWKALNMPGFIFYAIWGGRGGGKTENIAATIILWMIILDIQGMYFIAVRDAKDTTETTLYPVFIKIIEKYKLHPIFEIQREKITCKFNKNCLIFKGTVNYDNIKSIPNIYLIFMDEAANLSERAFYAIAYTLRAHKDCKFILSFNPKVRNFMYRNFIENVDQNTVSVKVNFNDNPWFKDNEILERLRQGLQKSNPQKYRHVFLGELESDGNVKPFDIEKLNLYDKLEDSVKRTITFLCITGDTAYKDGEQHDYSVFQLWGFAGKQGMYLIDQIRGKYEFPQLQTTLLKKFNQWSAMFPANKIKTFIENKASGISLVQQLKSQIKNIKEWSAHDYGLSGDKVARANSVSVLLDNRKVYINSNSSYTKKYMNELDLFGIDLRELKREERKQIHDDQVDATIIAMSIYIKLYYRQYKGLYYEQ